MRLNRRFLALTLVALAGMVAGGALASLYWVRERSSLFELQNRLAVFERLRLLHQLRAQRNPEAIAEQEILLDGDIVGLAAWTELRGKGDTGSLKALQNAARYRKEFPSALPNPASDRALARALAMVGN
jgi:hypothetical protein